MAGIIADPQWVPQPNPSRPSVTADEGLAIIIKRDFRLYFYLTQELNASLPRGEDWATKGYVKNMVEHLRNESLNSVASGDDAWTTMDDELERILGSTTLLDDLTGALTKANPNRSSPERFVRYLSGRLKNKTTKAIGEVFKRISGGRPVSGHLADFCREHITSAPGLDEAQTQARASAHRTISNLCSDRVGHEGSLFRALSDPQMWQTAMESAEASVRKILDKRSPDALRQIIDEQHFSIRLRFARANSSGRGIAPLKFDVDSILSDYAARAMRRLLSSAVAPRLVDLVRAELAEIRRATAADPTLLNRTPRFKSNSVPTGAGDSQVIRCGWGNITWSGTDDDVVMPGNAHMFFTQFRSYPSRWGRAPLVNAWQLNDSKNRLTAIANHPAIKGISTKPIILPQSSGSGRGPIVSITYQLNKKPDRLDWILSGLDAPTTAGQELLVKWHTLGVDLGLTHFAVVSVYEEHIDLVATRVGNRLVFLPRRKDGTPVIGHAIAPGRETQTWADSSALVGRKEVARYFLDEQRLYKKFRTDASGALRFGQQFQQPGSLLKLKNINKSIREKQSYLGRGSMSLSRACHVDREIKKLERKRRGIHSELQRMISSKIRKIAEHHKCVCAAVEDLSWSQHSKKSQVGVWLSRRQQQFFFSDIEKYVELWCEEEGVRFQKVSAAYTSTTCSNPDCGAQNASYRSSANHKMFECGVCHKKLDADLNAARNICKRRRLRFQMGGGAFVM